MACNFQFKCELSVHSTLFDYPHSGRYQPSRRNQGPYFDIFLIKTFRAETKHSVSACRHAIMFQCKTKDNAYTGSSSCSRFEYTTKQTDSYQKHAERTYHTPTRPANTCTFPDKGRRISCWSPPTYTSACCGTTT